MKKKVSYIFGAILSIIASIFPSTASASGVDMNYVPPKAFKDEKSYSDGKDYADAKTYTDTKGYADQKTYTDTKGYIDPKAYTDTKGYTDSKTFKDEKTYMDEKSNVQVITSKKGKSSVVVTSSKSKKTYTGSKVLLDGMAVPVSSTKGAKSEKEKLLKAVKEMGCFMVKNPDFKKPGEKFKLTLQKYGIKTDDASMAALEAKYGKDVSFIAEIEKAATCGGASSK